MAATNDEELDRQIKVMQHFRKGGEVEYSYRSNETWRPASTPQWDWADTDYRIKRAPVERWAVGRSNGEFFATYPEKETARLAATNMKGRVFLMREVLP